MAAMRHFILRSDMGVGVKELRDGDAAAAFKDKNISVTPVHIYPSGYVVSAQEQGPDESDAAATRRALMARAFGVHQEPQETDRRRREPVRQQQKKGYYGVECKESAIEQVLQKLEQGEEAPRKRALSPGHDAKQRNSSNVFLPLTKPTPGALCYIVEGPTVPGKFDAQAAQALGLKPGPHFAQLVRGQSITTADGVVIRPEQCVGPTRPSSIVIIVDCPSLAYIDSLTGDHRFAPFLVAPGSSMAEKGGRLMLVVHSLGAGVAQDARYRAWAARFPAHVQHMVSAPEHVPDNNPFQRHLRIQTAMNAISPHTYIMPQAAGTAELLPRAFIDSEKVIAPRSLVTFDMEPEPMLDESKVLPLLTPEEMRVKMQVGSASHQAAPPPPADGNDLVVCPIGTGSSVPSTYRNVSSNIVSVRGFGGMVLDCGESTVAMLKRFLGYPHRNQENTRVGQSYTEFVASLKLLYISHMHADHHLGAIQLLHEWNQMTDAMEPRPRMTILAPARFWAWLEDYAGVQDLGLDRLDFISCSDVRIFDSPSSKSSKYASAVARLKSDLGLVDVSTCGVIHCPWAYGVSMTHSSGWKLVYSGDTRPCASLVTLGRAGGQAPTILLHEATLPDSMHEDAVAKRHSTVSEAVAMALGMGAENLLLTHFSQRCLALPRWSSEHIEAVKISRYGFVASSSSNNNSPASGDAASSLTSNADDMEDSATELENDEFGNAMDAIVDSSADVDSVKEAQASYEQQLADQASESGGASPNAILGDLTVASAFDMSAYSPKDIAQYRSNVSKLRKVMGDELKLFIAEEDSESQQQHPDDKVSVKDKGVPKSKPAKAKAAKAKAAKETGNK
ncbi:hypothetical protein GGF43_005033 [Coemansia sp. RSA 2618]|nr:hypothetical protein GGF43_005033 [Coemansia sp. RSA 2618]